MDEKQALIYRDYYKRNHGHDLSLWVETVMQHCMPTTMTAGIKFDWEAAEMRSCREIYEDMRFGDRDPLIWIEGYPPGPGKKKPIEASFWCDPRGEFAKAWEREWDQAHEYNEIYDAAQIKHDQSAPEKKTRRL